jgi:hypothetical protein
MDERRGVVELRQYTLHPGQRDVLVELFERELLETQEAVGMRVIGQFRDLNNPNRFVWLRTFPDMTRRREALDAFYGGPVWHVHRRTANATMIDSDDVLLLRPATAASNFPPQPPRPEVGTASAGGTFVVTICPLRHATDPPEISNSLVSLLAASLQPLLAVLIEEPSENTYPALPVRAGEHVAVWINRATAPQSVATDDPLEGSPDLARLLRQRLAAPIVQLRLEATPRSSLR